MLDTMRSAAKSWVMKAFLGILLMSFLLWGIPEAFRYQGAGNNLFSSGDSSVTANDYLFERQNTLARFAVATGRFLNPAEVRAFGVPQQIMMQLQRRVLLDEDARRMRIGASDGAVLHLLQQDSLFRNEQTGSFDRNRFVSFTNQMQIPQEAIFSHLEKQARYDQILRSITDGMTVPDVMYHATLLYERETRSIDYIRLDAVSLDSIADPQEEELATWFEENKQNFRAPEYRTVTYMHMTRDNLIKEQNISDEAVEDYYQKNQTLLMTPEKRVVEQLRFENRQKADEAAAQLQAGTPFETLVAQQGQTLADIRLAAQSREEFASLMAPEVFSLGEGEISGVINDLAGPVIIRLVAIEESTPSKLEDVAQQIRQELAAQESLTSLRETRSQIENARFNGASLSELAAEYELDAVQVTLDMRGMTQQETHVENLPQREELLQAAFQSAQGVDMDPLFDVDSYLWYHVDNIIASRDKTLDEVRSQAVQAWKEAEVQRLLDVRANNFLVQMEEGKQLHQLAEENQLQVESVGGLQRGSINAILGSEANLAIFSILEGEFGMARGSDNTSRLLFKVTGSADPVSTSRDALSQREQEVVQKQISRDMEGQFISFSQQSHPVVQNSPLLNMLLDQ